MSLDGWVPLDLSTRQVNRLKAATYAQGHQNVAQNSLSLQRASLHEISKAKRLHKLAMDRKLLVKQIHQHSRFFVYEKVDTQS